MVAKTKATFAHTTYLQQKIQRQIKYYTENQFVRSVNMPNIFFLTANQKGQPKNRFTNLSSFVKINQIIDRKITCKSFPNNKIHKGPNRVSP